MLSMPSFCKKKLKETAHTLPNLTLTLQPWLSSLLKFQEISNQISIRTHLDSNLISLAVLVLIVPTIIKPVIQGTSASSWMDILNDIDSMGTQNQHSSHQESSLPIPHKWLTPTLIVQQSLISQAILPQSLPPPTTMSHSMQPNVNKSWNSFKLASKAVHLHHLVPLLLIKVQLGHPLPQLHNLLVIPCTLLVLFIHLWLQKIINGSLIQEQLITLLPTYI